MQKMMTRELEKKAPRLYETDGQGMDAVAVAHYFCPWNGWDWYMTEYDPDTKTAFGYVKGNYSELGYFNINEFEAMNKRRGFEVIERDTHWYPCKLKEVA